MIGRTLKAAGLAALLSALTAMTVTGTAMAGTSTATASAGAVATSVVPYSVAVRTSDGRLFADQGTGNFAGLGGKLLSTPSVAVSSVTGRAYYVGIGTDRQLWIRTDKQGWRPLLDAARPASCAYSASVAIAGSTFAAACTSADGHAYAASVALPHDGSAPTMPMLRNQGGGVSLSGPTVFFEHNRAALAVLSTQNAKGNVYLRLLRDPAGRYTQATGLACAAQAGFSTDSLYVGCQNGGSASNGAPATALYRSYENPSTGARYADLSGMMSGSVSVTTSPDLTLATYYVTDLHGVVWSRFVDHGKTEPWKRLGGKAAQGVSAAYGN